MAVVAVPRSRAQAGIPSGLSIDSGLTRRDAAWALAWAAVGGGRRAAPAGPPALRAPLAARIEGMLDDDQGVVGLMALDIASGRRWPIFFDGQRYMGAVEAYTAAAFVVVFGHSPAVVALAPLLFFGLFVAGQFAAWRLWAGRPTGHLAALVTAVGSPMLALWSVAPRGGYSELLAWALPVLMVYRKLTRPGAGRLSPLTQVGWGFLLAFGYYLNPLSLILYATLAFDWVWARHGDDLRRERRPGDWIASSYAALAWAALGGLSLALLAVGCQVSHDGSGGGSSRYVYALGLLPPRLGVPLGATVVAAVLGGAAWWTGFARRGLGRLVSHPWFTLGLIGALTPFLAYNLHILFGGAPRDPSLPIWIRAPWTIGPNLRDGLYALRPLVGCDPDAATFSVVGPLRQVPAPAWPTFVVGLHAATPTVVALIVALVATVAWRDRRAWRSVWSLRGRAPTPPTVLALTGLFACLGLYLLQSTSVSRTSIRYLLPVWIVLPGLLARGLLTWPRPARMAATAILLGTWAASQGQLYVEMGRPCPLRPLAGELERRGVAGIVAPSHVALLVADLTAGRVGGLEYQHAWPRLRQRYANRFVAGRPIVCVVDLGHRLSGDGDLGQALYALALRRPGRVRRTGREGHYEIWEADLTLSELLEYRPSSCPGGLDRRR
jgi:hypothetical protein